MKTDNKEQMKVIDSILERSENEEAVNKALIALFPNIWHPRSDEEIRQARLDRRINQREFCAEYFRMDPQPISWPRTEIEAIFELQDPTAAISRVFEYIEKFPEENRPRMTRLFLEDLASNASAIATKEWISTLIQHADTFLKYDYEDSRYTSSRRGGFDRIVTAVYRSINSLDFDEREDITLFIIREIEDVSVVSDLLRLMTIDKHPDGSRTTEGKILSLNSAEKLRDILLDKVRQIAKTHSFWNQLKPWEILWFWWSCDMEDEVKDFTQSYLDDRNVLRILMSSSMSMVYSTGGNYEHVNVDSLGYIVDIDRFKYAVERFGRESDDEDSLSLIDRFQKGVERWQQSPRGRKKE